MSSYRSVNNAGDGDIGRGGYAALSRSGGQNPGYKAQIDRQNVEAGARPAADPANPTEAERELIQKKLGQYQAIFDTH